MSSGLMASAHMRMKQKREKASPGSKLSSPASNASPTAAAGASPRTSNNNNGNDNNSGTKKNPVVAPPDSLGPDGYQHDSRRPEYEFASPQQQLQQQKYSLQYDGNNHYHQQQYQQPQIMAAPSPLASSPNRPMRKDEPFDSAIQHRGNYTHHLSYRNQRSPNRPRRGYDSYTDAPKEEQEKFNQEYYQHLQQTPPRLPPQARQHGEIKFHPFTPSPLSVANTASGNNNNDLQPRNERSPYFHDTQLNPELLQDENMMDGEYEYDITEEEEAYVHERKDIIAPVIKRTPVYSPNIDKEENETISSEVALNGDPSKKKEKKSKQPSSSSKSSKSSPSKDARYLIHNVGSDDAMDKPAAVSDPRYGIHLTGSNDDDDDFEVYEDEGRNASPDRPYNYGDMAAHAGRYAAASQPVSFAHKPSKAKTTNPFDDVSTFGSKGGHLPKRIGNANSWDGDENSKSSQVVDDDNENSNVAVWEGGKKQRNMWEDDNSNTMQKFERNSKSWDQEKKDSFEQKFWAGSFFGESSLSQQKHQQPNEQTLAEWDKAEAEWQNKVSPSRLKAQLKDKELDSVMDKSYPWKTQPQNPPAASRVYSGRTEVNMPVSDSEESDGDSLFKFEDNNKKNSALNDDTSTDPKEIFNKISHGLQQAGDARNVPQNHNQSETLKKFGDQEPTSPSRNVAFAEEEENKVHTYAVPREREHSESDSGTYETRDDEDDEETDGDTLEDGDTLDNYTLDDTTYAESTLGGTITSRKAEKETNILDHVDHAVAAIGSALGGLFVLANKAAATLSIEDVDNTNTQENSTIGQESMKKETKSEYDWIGYVEKFLFPETEGEDATTNGSSTLRSNSHTASGEDEDDDYLLQQALASAKAIHQIHGIQFDEKQDINVLTDIKFVVVTVALPLGLLFQDHELGAWVSRVVPDGNGARKGVQAGDQLAAINGKSSAHATIDEVASIISGTPRNEGVELTFLRYVGPLRPFPGAIIQEGFEVTDKNVSKNGGKSKKGIFGLSSLKKSNQAIKITTPASTGNKASLDFSPNPRRSARNHNATIQQQSKTNSKPNQPAEKDKGKSAFKKIFGGKKS